MTAIIEKKTGYKRSATCSLLIALLFLSLPMQAVELDPDQQYAGVKLGFINAGTVDIDGIEYDSESAWSFGAFFDFPLAPVFHYGLSVDFHRMKWKVASTPLETDAANTLIDIGANFRLFLNPGHGRVALRPGIGVGYGTLKEMHKAGSTTYFTLRATSEIIVATDGALGFLGEIGIWYTAAGSDDTRDVNIGPLVFARLGIIYQ